MVSGDDKPKKGGDVAHASTAISSPGVDTGPMVVGKPDALVGRVIADRYRVVSLLGRGGMGSVYVSEHVQLSKPVALKVLSDHLKDQPDLVQRFLKEARAAAQIGHPNIVDVFDLGELPEGGAYIAMALLEGHDLEQELERSGPMPVARARIIVAEICRALAAAHGKGIVHRDMKPANVFLSRHPDGQEQVKVLDFGIAQIQDPSEKDARLTQTGAIVGTPAFMSPEQGRGDRPDHRTDIYSVGCILYTLVTGTLPFEAGTLMGVITKHLFDPPDPPSERRPDLQLPPDLDALVLRAMAKKPDDRFQTMKDMWGALEALSDSPMAWPDASSGRFQRLTPAPIAGARVSSTSELAPPSRSQVVPIAIGICVLALAGAAAVVLRKTPKPVPVAVAPAVVAPVAVVNDVTVEVRSTPPGATVWSGDKQLGTTPLRMVRPRSDDTLDLRLATDGCSDESVSVQLDHDRIVDVRMRPDVHEPAPVTPPVATPKAHDATPPRPKAAKAGRDGQLKNPFAQ